MNSIIKKIELLKNQVEKTNAKGIAIAIDGTLQSAVCAAMAKKAFPENIFSFYVGINSERNFKRNYLRIVDLLGLKNISIDLTNIYEEFIKATFEIINPYESLEIYEQFHKTGNAPKDMSYLQSEKLNDIRQFIKESFISTAIESQAIKLNYLVLDYQKLVSNKTKTDLINYAKELNIPDNIIEFLKGEQIEK